MNAPKETKWWRRLRALAELAGDSQQKQIAETLGVSPAAVTSWRHGQPPSPDNVKAAAHAYGVDPLELMGIAYLDDEEAGDAGKAARGIRGATKTRHNKTAAAKAPLVIAVRHDKDPL
jgi:transcriptional regulator with XRE-family HTH domain